MIFNDQQEGAFRYLRHEPWAPMAVTQVGRDQYTCCSLGLGNAEHLTRFDLVWIVQLIFVRLEDSHVRIGVA